MFYATVLNAKTPPYLRRFFLMYVSMRRCAKIRPAENATPFRNTTTWYSINADFYYINGDLGCQTNFNKCHLHYL